MCTTLCRGRDKLFLVHQVLARLKGRGYFSAHQVANATYHGCGKVHPQQRRRVKNILEQYVQAGILERNDTLAACTLYRHRDVTLDDVDQEMVEEFEKHAASRRMTYSYRWDLTMLDQYLDRLIPKDADPELFNEHGHLESRSFRDWRERPKDEPERPRVLGYLEAGN